MYIENEDGKTIFVDESRPAYRVLATHGFFGFDDTLHKENAIIYHEGEPNEEMEPLTEPAQERMSVYLDKLDELGRQVAAKTGKAYHGRPRGLDGGLEMATAVQRAEMSIMGIKRISADTASAESVVPETGAVKRGRGRPARAVV